MVQKLVTHEVPRRSVQNSPNCSTSGASSRRQAPVESESLPEICDPVPDAKGGVLREKCNGVQGSRGAGTRSCASSRPARWQRGGQQNQRATTCAEVRTGGFWTTTPPIAHAGRSFDASRWKVGRIAPGAKSCEVTRSATELANRSWDFFRVCKGARAASGRRCRNRPCLGRAFQRLLCPGSSASPWSAASCCRDGSLAVIQPLWVQKTSEVSSIFEGVAATHTCAHSTSNACTSVGRQCSTTHPSQSFPYGSIHPHLAGNVHASVRASGAEKEGSCPTACATSPILVGRDRSF